MDSGKTILEKEFSYAMFVCFTTSDSPGYFQIESQSLPRLLRAALAEEFRFFRIFALEQALSVHVDDADLRRGILDDFYARLRNWIEENPNEKRAGQTPDDFVAELRRRTGLYMTHTTYAGDASTDEKRATAALLAFLFLLNEATAPETVNKSELPGALFQILRDEFAITFEWIRRTHDDLLPGTTGESATQSALPSCPQHLLWIAQTDTYRALREQTAHRAATDRCFFCGAPAPAEDCLPGNGAPRVHAKCYDMLAHRIAQLGDEAEARKLFASAPALLSAFVLVTTDLRSQE